MIISTLIFPTNSNDTTTPDVTFILPAYRYKFYFVIISLGCHNDDYFLYLFFFLYHLCRLGTYESDTNHTLTLLSYSLTSRFHNYCRLASPSSPPPPFSPSPRHLCFTRDLARSSKLQGVEKGIVEQLSIVQLSDVHSLPAYSMMTQIT